MPISELNTPARARRRAWSRADMIDRAAAAVILHIDDLPPIDQLIVLNSILEDKLKAARSAGVLSEA